MEEKKTVFEAAPATPNMRVEKEKTEKVVIDVTGKEFMQTVLFVIYILYRTHWLSTVQLRNILNFIHKTDHPKSIAQYLVEEAAKA